MIIEGKTTESLISVHKVITIDNKSDIIRQYGQYNHIDWRQNEYSIHEGDNFLGLCVVVLTL